MAAANGPSHWQSRDVEPTGYHRWRTPLGSFLAQRCPLHLSFPALPASRALRKAEVSSQTRGDVLCGIDNEGKVRLYASQLSAPHLLEGLFVMTMEDFGDPGSSAALTPFFPSTLSRLLLRFFARGKGF